MTLQETLAKLNWGGAGYGNYQGYGQTTGVTGTDIGADPFANTGGGIGGTMPTGDFTDFGPSTVSTGTPQTISIGDTSGVAGFDLNGFVNSLGTAASSVMKTYGSISGTQVSNLGSGQYLVNGQLVNTNPIFNQGSSNLILIVGIALVAFLLLRRGKE